MWNVANNNRETAKTMTSSVGHVQILTLKLQLELQERQIDRQRHTIVYPGTPPTFIFNVTPSISWTLKASRNQARVSLKEVERSDNTYMCLSLVHVSLSCHDCRQFGSWCRTAN